MLKTWSNAASVASSLQIKAICHPLISKQYLLLGPLQSGGLIWSDPLKGEAIRKKYLLVMVDKFTKWIEAKLVKTAESGPVIDFISAVVHHYGVPHSIITDNGLNFTADDVKTWCSNMGIKLDYASVYHPQTNGQVERANGLIMSSIKPRLVRSLTESNMH